MIGKSRVHGRGIELLRNTFGSVLRIIVRRLRAQVHKPTGVYAVDRQIACHILAQIRRGEADGASTFLAMHHGAFHGMRMSQNRVGVFDAPLAQQVAHIRGAPHAHGLRLVFLAPCATFRLGRAFQRIGRLTMVGGHNRLRIGWHAGFARSTIVDHVKLEHAGGERQILDGLHIAGTVRTHGRIGSEH